MAEGLETPAPHDAARIDAARIDAALGPVTVEVTAPAGSFIAAPTGSLTSGETTSRVGGIKVRLTLGPALIDLEATLEEIVVVVTRLTQEFTRASIITSGAN